MGAIGKSGVHSAKVPKRPLEHVDNLVRLHERCSGIQAILRRDRAANCDELTQNFARVGILRVVFQERCVLSLEPIARNVDENVCRSYLRIGG